MNIPTLNESNITTTNAQTTPQRPTSSPVTQALGEVGSAVEHVAGQELQHLGELKYQADDARTDELHANALEQVNKLNYDPTTDPTDNQPKGYLLKQGKSAIGLAAKGQEQLKQILSSSMEGITDLQQQRLLKHKLNNIEPSEMLSYHRHEAQQTELYHGSTAQSVITANERLMPTLATADPTRYAELFSANQAQVMKLAQMKGVDPGDAVAESGDRNIKEAVQYIANELRDPEKAHRFLADHSRSVSPGTMALLDHELEPARRANRVMGYAEEAIAAAQDKTDPTAPIDEEKAMDTIRAKTSDPEERKLAHELLTQRVADHEKALKVNYEHFGGMLVDKWEANPSMTVLDIEKEPEFGKLPPEMQGKLRAKIRQSIEHRDTTERQTAAAERSANAAARAAATAAKREAREASKDASYRLMAEPGALSRMSDDEYKLARAGLHPEDQVKLDEDRKKLKDPKKLRDAHAHKEVVDSVLASIPGMKDGERTVLSGRLMYKLGKLQQDKGGQLTDEETRDAVIDFTRLQWVEESHLPFNRTVAKRGISMLKDDKPAKRPQDMQARLDAVAKKRGKAKLSPSEETALEQAILEQDRAKAPK